MKRLLRSLTTGVVLLSFGCATVGMDHARAPSAVKAGTGLPEQAKLDVAIVEFEPGVAVGKEPYYPEIRKAEATLFPTQLKNTLTESGQWGATAVLPKKPASSDLTVTGTILQSNGRKLKLAITAQDSAGRKWLDREYYTTVDGYDPVSRVDPYQPMFNTIANDLVEARNRLDAKQLADIATISDLKFAEALSPEAFSGYLSVDEDGIVSISRLPAIDDPMLERVAQARLRDEMFLDMLDSHYQLFRSSVGESHWQWREASDAEMRTKDELRNQQIARGVGVALTIAVIAAAAVLGSGFEAAAAGVAGAVIIQNLTTQIFELQKDKAMAEASLQEVAQSFQAEVRPRIVTLGETTVRLTGTAAKQYDEWQRLLRTVYEAENAIVADVYMVPRQPTIEPELDSYVIPAVSSTSPAQ